MRGKVEAQARVCTGDHPVALVLRRLRGPNTLQSHEVYTTHTHTNSRTRGGGGTYPSTYTPSCTETEGKERRISVKAVHHIRAPNPCTHDHRPSHGAHVTYPRQTGPSSSTTLSPCRQQKWTPGAHPCPAPCPPTSLATPRPSAHHQWGAPPARVSRPIHPPVPVHHAATPKQERRRAAWGMRKGGMRGAGEKREERRGQRERGKGSLDRTTTAPFPIPFPCPNFPPPPTHTSPRTFLAS